MRPFIPQSRSVAVDTFARTLRRLQGYEHLGLDEEACRELEALPSAIRELPAIQLRLGRALERLSQVDEALALYDRMERSAFSQLGRVRCLVRSDRREEAAALLARIPFDAAAVKEFVEARNLIG